MSYAILSVFAFRGYNLVTVRSDRTKNMLRFLGRPEMCFPMFSENDWKKVCRHIFQTNYRGEESVKDLFEFFRVQRIQCKNLKNNGVLYGFIFYSPDVEPLWSDERSRQVRSNQRTVGELNLEYVDGLIRRCLKEKETLLDLGYCGLTDLNDCPGLFECTQLETLILSNEWGVYNEASGWWEKKESGNKGRGWKRNVLSCLPEGLKRLKNLKRLVCGGDWNGSRGGTRWGISKLGGVVGMKSLECLNLSNNEVGDLTGLEDLTGLRELYLNNNQIVSVGSLKKLVLLEEVFLSNNLIEKPFSFKDALHLKTLDLHANRIRSLQPLLKLVERMGVENDKWKWNALCVAQNPLERPPMEVVNTGKDAVLQYFKDVKNGESYVNREVKVILAGNSEVGKTTLVKYLNGGKELDEPHPATHWMEEKVFESKYEVKGMEGKCLFHVFDFGGHDYFHDTHHLFYSVNALYVLLWDKNPNKVQGRTVQQLNCLKEMKTVSIQDYPLRYWLESIRHFIKEEKAENIEGHESEETYNGAVLVVQNKADDAGQMMSLNNQELSKRFPFVFDFINVSILKGRNLRHFDDLMSEMLSNLPMVGAVLPGYYQIVKESIEKEEKEEEKKEKEEKNGREEEAMEDRIVSMEGFHEYCNQVLGMELTPEQVSFLASYLKQVGTILVFPEGTTERVCIRKKWVLERIYWFLFDVSRLNGEFRLEDLRNNMEGKHKGDGRHAEMLVEAMLGFEMVFQHPLGDKYIAPLYLPAIPDSMKQLFLGQGRRAYRRIEYPGFIHKHVILRFFQRYGRLVSCDDDGLHGKCYYWKDCLIVKEDEEVVMIRFNLGEDEKCAYIDVFDLSERSEERLVEKVLDDLRNINEKYETDELVTLDGEDFVSLDVLRSCCAKKEWVFCRNRKYESENELEEKKSYKLRDYRRFLDDWVGGKKVVISYSKKDLEYANSLIRYLKPLMDDGLIGRSWYCTALEAGEEWDEKIKREFSEADIVFFMISQYFYSTPYIVEHEIKLVVDRYNKEKKVRIVPVVLDFYDWSREGDYGLKKFAALPYQAKPVRSFENPNLAWHTITLSIRAMIDNELSCLWEDEKVQRELLDIYERQVKGRLDRNSGDGGGADCLI